MIQEDADEHYMNGSMTHQEIQNREIIEQYVRHKLSLADRQAFQEHYFNCDECFEQTQLTARFVAGVRAASSSGVLAAEQDESLGRTSLVPANWLRSWAVPVLALSFLLAAVLLGLWALSMRRENQRLAQQTSEQRHAAEQLRNLEAKVRELEASGGASQQEKESLAKEVNRLKEKLAATESQPAPQVAQLPPPDVMPVRNIYPVGDAQRSAGTGDVNRLNLPAQTKNFALILSDFQPGSSQYRVEITDASGRIVTRRAGLKPDRQGEVSILLNRARFTQGRYTVKLLAPGKTVAEYIVEIE